MHIRKRGDSLGDVDTDAMLLAKKNVKVRTVFGSEYGQMEGFCVYSDEPSDWSESVSLLINRVDWPSLREEKLYLL
jgi:hypothetical protein